MDVGNLMFGFSAFSKFNLCTWKFSVHVLLMPSLEDFEHYFASEWDECNCVVVWIFFGLALLWDWNTHLFQSCGHCWVFQICSHTECRSLTTSSFRVWNSLAGIQYLHLFIVILPKAYLTLRSKMSGCRWVIAPLWLSGSLRSFIKICFVQFFCVFLPSVLISSASVMSLLFLSFAVSILAWNVPLVSLTFFQRSIVFPSLLFSSISVHGSLTKAFLSLLPIWNSAFSGNIFPFLRCL